MTRDTTPAPRRRQGFAALTRERHAEIARNGGRRAHEMGRAHEFTSETAKEAGRKGGLASQAKRRAAAEQPPEPEPGT